MDACIGELAIAATLEGRGCGRALLAAAEEWAAGRGLPHITVETGADNHRAPALLRTCRLSVGGYPLH